MSQDRPEVLTRSVQETDIWLKDLMEDLRLETPSQAYRVLRAVLHALRDRLTVGQTANLAAQFPAMLAGIYYDGWDPAAVPKKIRDAETFIADANARAAPDGLPDPPRAIGAVFRLLERKLSPGTFDKTAAELPQQVRALRQAG